MTEISETNDRTPDSDSVPTEPGAVPASRAPASGSFARWVFAATLPGIAIPCSRWIPPWAAVWLIASTLFLGLKLLAWPRPIRRRDTRLLFIWIFLWPGMDPFPLLSRQTCPSPSFRDWFEAVGKTMLGAILLWGVARQLAPPLLAGWVGMIGFITFLHFGLFHVAALVWQSVGIAATPLMRNPLAATSLGEFWGSRWNRGFSDVARRCVLRPLAPTLGLRAASMIVFAFSGLVHELVISIPAGGGYGVPIAYFIAQGLAALWQRSHPSWASGWRGRFFTLTAVAAPAFWLFPPLWVERCMLPLFHVIHAL